MDRRTLPYWQRELLGFRVEALPGLEGVAESTNEPAGSQKMFSQTLEDRGYQKDKTMTGAFFRGITLKN
jgi:hypothetical protein